MADRRRPPGESRLVVGFDEQAAERAFAGDAVYLDGRFASVPMLITNDSTDVTVHDRDGRQARLRLPATSLSRVNTDGEVEAFYRWPIDQVIEVIATSERFKFNCALVVIDFLVRHGHIEESDADYVAIVQGLRAGRTIG